MTPPSYTALFSGRSPRHQLRLIKAEIHLGREDRVTGWLLTQPELVNTLCAHGGLRATGTVTSGVRAVIRAVKEMT